MKKLHNLANYIFIVLFALSYSGYAQDIELSEQWVFNNTGGDREDEITGVVTDSQGNVYITGYFSGTINLDPDGANSGILTATDGNAAPDDINTDIFVAKYNADGDLLRVRQLDYKGFNDVGRDIALSNDESLVYVIGQARGEEGDDDDIYLASLNASNLELQKVIQSSSPNNERGRGIVVRGNGDVYVTGYFEKTVELFSGSFTPEVSPFSDTAEEDGLFVLVFDKNLTTLKNSGVAKGTGDVRSQGIDIDNQGNAYLTGEYSNKLTFAGAGTRTSQGARDIFCAKYNLNNENFDFAFSLGSNQNDDDRARSLAILGNSFYITGDFRNTVDFDPASSNSSSIKTVDSHYDFFIARYTLAGAYQNVYQVGGTDSRSFEQGFEIVTRNNLVYVAGRIISKSRDVGDIRFFEELFGNDNADAFLAIFPPDISEPTFVQRYGRTNFDYAQSLDITPDGDIFLGGFTDWARNGSGSLVNNTKNSYLVKFEQEDDEEPSVVIVSDKLSSQVLESVTLGGRDANIADFDTDGDLDLAVAFKLGSAVRWYPNTNGSFSSGIALQNNLDNPRTISSADFDGSNGPDIVMADDPNGGSELRRYSNTGGGNFANPQKLTDDYAGSSDVYAGDLDKDGNPDIVLTNFESKNIVFFKSNNGGNFPNETIIDNTAGRPRVVEVGDLDRDESGLLDLVVVLKDDNNTAADEDQVIWYKNLGNSNFSSPVEIANNTQVEDIRGAAIADFDGDFDLDIVLISNADSEVFIIENQGGGEFANPRNIGSVTRPFVVDATDLDGDGNIDLLVGTENDGDNEDDGNIIWFKNDGEAAFTQELLLTVDKGKPQSIVSDDLDKDGDQDFVVAFAEDPEFEVASANVLLSLTNNVQSSPNPLIKNVSAEQGNPGDIIQIYGGNFGSLVGTAQVSFGENEAQVLEVFAEGTQLRINVPELEDDLYDIVVRLPNGNIAVYENFVVGNGPSEDPFISQVTPFQNVTVGAEVTIQGGGFGSNPTVKLNETVATVNSVNAEGTTIQITIPELAEGDYDITVTPEGKDEVGHDTKISIVPSGEVPVVTSTTPDRGPVDTEVTLTGSQLSEVTALFDGVAITPTVQTNTQIKFLVPNTAVIGDSYSIEIAFDESIITVATFEVIDGSDLVPPLINPGNIVSTYQDGDEIVFTANVTDDGSGVDKQSVKLGYRKLEDQNFTELIMGSQDNENFSATLSASDLSALLGSTGGGIAYFFSAADLANNASETEVEVINRQFSVLNLLRVSPIANADDPQQLDYQMIGIPLESQSVSSQFDELGEFKSDNTGDWTLYRYNSTSGEYQANVSSFEPGVGYMFAYRNFSGTIELSGQTVQPTDNAFPVTINSGFTLISNPYLFDIDWEEVLQYNIGLGVIDESTGINTNLLKWKHGIGWSTDESDLQSFEGAFVEAPGITESVTLQIPVITAARVDSDARKDPFSKDLSASAWYLPLTLQSENQTYQLGGIGMHPDAKITGDRFDNLTPPRFIDFLELNVLHSESSPYSFTKDIIPTQSSYVWDFEVAASKPSTVTLSWNNQEFGNSDYQLMLLDTESLIITDLRSESNYRFAADQPRKFQLFYGTNQEIQEAMQSDQYSVGQPYPNPMTTTLSFPISVPDSEGRAEVKVDIYDITGQRIANQTYTTSGGYHTLEWQGTDHQGRQVPPGLYIYQVQPNAERKFSGKFMVK